MSVVSSSVASPPARFRSPRASVVKTLIYVFSGIVIVYVLAPVVMLFLASVGLDSASGFNAERLTFDAYGDIPGRLIEAAGISIALAAATTAGALLIGVPAAFAIRGSSAAVGANLYAWFRLPIIVPQVVIGLALYQMLTLTPVGVQLVQETFLGMWFGHLVICTPYVISVVSTSIAGVKDSMFEASSVLGASRLRTYCFVILPLLRPAIFASGFFAFLISFDNVPISLFLAGAGTSTLPVELYFSVTLDLRPYIFAISTLIAVFALIASAAWGRMVGFRALA